MIYSLLKKQYYNEKCVSMPIPCKFRCGVALIIIETGRYENVSEGLRLCPIFQHSIKSKSHLLLHCETKDIAVDNEFYTFSVENKTTYLLSNQLIAVVAWQSFLIPMDVSKVDAGFMRIKAAICHLSILFLFNFKACLNSRLAIQLYFTIFRAVLLQQGENVLYNSMLECIYTNVQ